MWELEIISWWMVAWPSSRWALATWKSESYKLLFWTVDLHITQIMTNRLHTISAKFACRCKLASWDPWRMERSMQNEFRSTHLPQQLMLSQYLQLDGVHRSRIGIRNTKACSLTWAVRFEQVQIIQWNCTWKFEFALSVAGKMAHYVWKRDWCHRWVQLRDQM
jgi:hypothetical protein